MMTRFVAGFRSTVRLIAADRAAVVVLVGTGIVYSFFYPAPYRHQVASQLPVVVVDLDRSPMSRAVVRKVLAVRAVRVTASVSSVAEARTMVDAGEAHGIVMIGADFQREILRGRQGEVALFGSGAMLSHGGTVLAGLGDAVAAFGPEAALGQARFAGVPSTTPFRLVQRPLFNTLEGYGSAVVPAVAGVIVHQTLLVGIVLLAGARRERLGTLAQSTPELAGVMAAFGAIGILNLFYYSGFVFWYQDYPRAGNAVGMAVAGGLFIAAATSLALFVGSFFKVRERALQVIAVTSLPMFFLANVSWPAPASPLLLTWIAKLLPTTPGINAMVKFNQMGALLSETMPELLNLAVLVLFYGGLAAWRYRADADTRSNDRRLRATVLSADGT